MLSLEPQIIQGYNNAILTPNVVEFARLYSAVVKLLVIKITHTHSVILTTLYVLYLAELTY